MVEKKKPSGFLSIFTDYTKDENFSFDDPFRCYFCKRHDGNEIVIIQTPGENKIVAEGKKLSIHKDEAAIVYDKVQVGIYTIIEKEVEINFPICNECLLFLSRFKELKREYPPVS